MTKQEIAAALAVARSDESLLDVDDTVLAGLYLPTFRSPVTTTIRVVAKALRDLVCQFNGGVDAEALAEFASVARRKVLIA
jgi:hypothetical protein